MATQYTAGLTTGQVLTAATMNSIGAAWETWTPAFRSTGGTITSLTVNYARYARIQKTVFARIDVLITTIGTGTGVLRFDLPVTAFAGTQGLAAGSYREINVLGFIGVINVDTTTTGTLTKYDNASGLGSNYRFTGVFTYEAA